MRIMHINLLMMLNDVSTLVGETWTIANVESEGFNWELSLKKI